MAFRLGIKAISSNPTWIRTAVSKVIVNIDPCSGSRLLNGKLNIFSGVFLNLTNTCHVCQRSLSTERNRPLESRTALVTGSTSGIGLGVARGLADKGCSVILTGFADQDLINKLKEEFKSNYAVQSEYIPADLTKAEELKALCETSSKFFPSGVDILFNNAGFQFVSPVEEFPTDKWNDMIAVMLSAPYHLIKYLLPGMKNRGYGRIINLSSVHGLRASPYKSAYVSAKHGLVGLTKVIALETAGTGVTCNAICPGYVDTPILQMQVENLSHERNITYDEAQHEFLSRFHPSKAPIDIDHIAEMCVFLCSEAGGQMTGSSVVMDGGWTSK